jgi:hypothetical protein
VHTGWYRVNSAGTPDYIDPLSRYQNYKTARAAKLLDAGFETLSIWHMRLVVDAWVRDVDLDWLRTTYAGPHSVVSEAGVTRSFTTAYTRANIADSGHELEYNLSNVAGGSVHSGTLVFYGADADIERVLKVGGVCGAIAKYGSTVAQAYGIPAFPVAQPGHAAAFINNASGNWVMHNDIFGMGASFRHDGTTIPLMSDTNEPYLDSEYGIGTRNYAPAYVLLYEQLVGPRAATFTRAEWLRWAARGVTKSSLRQRLLTHAVTVEPMDVLAWRDRIAASSSGTTTVAQWQGMLTSVSNAFASQPRVLSELAARIEPKVINGSSSDATKSAFVATLYTRYDAIPASSQHAAMRDVILAAMPDWMRTFIPAPSVSVAFSGESAGTISGFKTGMAYSVDGGATWITPATEGFLFPIADIATLQSTRAILVRNRSSTSTDPSRAAVLPVSASTAGAPALVADDQADTLTGMTTAMEYSINNGKSWTTYTNDDALTLARHISYTVRYRGNGTTLPSLSSRYDFTLATDYAKGTSASESDAYTGYGAAKAIDGNDTSSYWLSGRSVTPSDTPLTLIVDLGVSRAVDHVLLRWTQNLNDWEGFGKAYTIAVADTVSEPTAASSDWNTVKTVTAGDGGYDSLSFGSTRARFVRLRITESAGRNPANWRWTALYTIAVSGSDAIPVIAATTGVQYLSDRLWSGSSWYASENGIDTACEKYQSGNRILLDGTAYLKGIGLCYNMTLHYALDGTQSEFVAEIGIDDSVTDSDTREVKFEVIADTTTVYTSPVMKAASAHQSIAVPITGAKLLTIKYYSIDGSYPPEANWANAYYH